MSITITRGNCTIQLTEQEIDSITNAALRKARLETCRLMVQSYLESLGVLETCDTQKIEFFMNQVLPEAEQERLSLLYKERYDDLTAPYDLWMSVLGGQIHQKNSLMCKAMRRFIFDHCSVKQRTEIMTSEIYNPYGKSNFDAVLACMTARSLVKIWKNFRFIELI